MKRIGVLTSGGDCAGLNAALRAIALAASKHHIEVVGIKRGTTGLMVRPFDYEVITPQRCDGAMLRAGGTILGSTNKDDPFNFPGANGKRTDESHRFAQGVKELELDAIIGIGGDGSLRIMKNLMEKTPFNFIAIPKTIDNDVPLTSLSIGYETALTIATEALDRLHTTAASHDRVMILEVMGRDAGHIALNAGIAGGADIILVPEIPYTLEGILGALDSIKSQGRDHTLMVVSESVPMPAGDTKTIEYPDHRVRYGGIAHALGELIARSTKREVRTQHLGHMQRGGTPCARDRILGTLFGYHAITLALQGQFNRMVAWNGAEVTDVAIESVFGKENIISPEDQLIQAARALGIYVGDVK